ncbi:hypothetical protein A2W13_02490 [Candidatus Woesebacteria bacterium RBG_16_36_11]|uniref:Glycosyltransferase 2-like domain-containing protein n=2 Tax=Candidatus Woeseibacteriota TaxID=1752722 RepID=A0A1F7X9K6_9BACT|nr:MAG: hypothetical protein A2Z67_03960 [Candidatus Woesebacteria bacterium RBG_13_36_22]OGM11710.1 MAG: hypothetical protein A2W13_02490 [Candidatus Woesebacteria bacterium RBG_16_36_11]
MLDLAILILNYNTPDLTIKCLKSILESNFNMSYKIWVVDNASTDDSADKITNFISQNSNLNLIKNSDNLGFSKGNNVALKKAYKDAKYTLLLNSDTVVDRDSISNLVNFAKNKNFDIASCKLLGPDNSFQPNAGSLPKPFAVYVWLSGLDDIFRKFIRIESYQERSKSYYLKDREVGWVSGSVMLVNSRVFEKIGFFDEKIFMYGEDVDLCWRAKDKGFKVGWTNSAEILHIGGASSDKPKYVQWLGEFKGLLYLYNKHYNKVAEYLLKLLIYFFVLLRCLAFLILGKKAYAKTYAEVIKNI